MAAGATKKAKGTKKGRKYTRNAVKCARYRAENRREKNAKSRAIRRLRGMRSPWAKRALSDLLT